MKYETRDFYKAFDSFVSRQGLEIGSARSHAKCEHSY